MRLTGDDIDVLLVSGGRDETDRTWRTTAETLLQRYRPMVLIHGDAKGIDTIFKEAAERTNLIGIEAYPAEWDKWEKLGKRNFAGRARNQEMFDRLKDYTFWGKKVMVITVHPDIESSKGTKHMRGIVEREKDVPYVHIAQPLR